MSERKRCEVCQGIGKIKLPLYKRVSVVAYDPAAAPPAPEIMSKEFPCPECAPTVPEERVAFLECCSEVVAYDNAGLDFDEHVERTAAYTLVDEMRRRGFISFKKGPVRDYDGRYTIRGRAGVVSTATVASMEQRISQHQGIVAAEVAREAIAQILVWGSQYTGSGGNISKGQAVDAVNAALKAVLTRRKETVE